MSTALEEFGLRSQSNWMTPLHRSFRPPSWPPPRNWVVSEDEDGNSVSCWGDARWDLSTWAGKPCSVYFGDGEETPRGGPRTPRMSQANADTLRLLLTWRIWGPRGISKVNSLKAIFLPIRRVVLLCDQNNILATELSHHPEIIDQIPDVLNTSNYDTCIIELQRFWDAREQTGIILVEPDGIRRLAAASPRHETQQTAYIPPRIWTYTVERLRECLADFLTHENQIKACFDFCLDSYKNNWGTLEAAVARGKINSNLPPFQDPPYPNADSYSGRKYHGKFEITAQRFGIHDLLNRWVVQAKFGTTLSQLGAYLTLIQNVGLAYIASFTLQRISEVASLRANCLSWEEDDRIGRVPIICGTTTKTQVDHEARWPTTPSVEIAVSAMSAVAYLRVKCAAAHPKVGLTNEDLENPYIFDRAYDPWSPCMIHRYTTRHQPGSYLSVLGRFPLLFDLDKIKITDEDMRIARMLTPNLDEEKGFAIGRPWPLAWHQLRRTSAVNMFASGLISDSSMQFQMKHSSRVMTLYYAHGHSKLRLNEEVEGIVIAAMYEVMAHKIKLATSSRFVSPLGDERKQAFVINLVAEKDHKALAASAQRGEVSYREMRLGACTKRGTCDWGGIESIARCGGGDGDRACADALFDRERVPEIERELAHIQVELDETPKGSHRHTALLAERNSMENFLNVFRS
jgi:integrase